VILSKGKVNLDAYFHFCQLSKSVACHLGKVRFKFIRYLAIRTFMYEIAVIYGVSVSLLMLYSNPYIVNDGRKSLRLSYYFQESSCNAEVLLNDSSK
jgi:hypothetical protein